MHYLRIFRKFDDCEDEYDYWEIVHEPECPIEYTCHLFHDYGCNLGFEITHVGLDSLDQDWQKLEPGLYPIELWSEYYSYCHEWDGGIRIVEFPPGL